MGLHVHESVLRNNLTRESDMELGATLLFLRPRLTSP